MRAVAILVVLFLAVAAPAHAQQCGVDDAPPMSTLPAPVAPPPPSIVAAASPLTAPLAVIVALVGVAGLLVVARGQRWRLTTRTSWSPYLAGAGLGAVATVSLAVFGKRLTGSGAYHQLGAWIGARLAPDNPYFCRLPTGLTWEILLLLGMLAGAFTSALSGGELRLRTMPDSQWTDVFGPSVAKRWLIVFAGTAVIQLAAGIAGGCTAGLAVSGGAALAPGAFVFMAGMFGGGIPLARWLYRGRRS